ncbi:hypothetical protein [Arthrobacter sp. UYEF20]
MHRPKLPAAGGLLADVVTMAAGETSRRPPGIALAIRAAIEPQD